MITEALDVIASGKPRMLEFGVADETAWRVGLSCGGTHPGLCREGGLRQMKLETLTELNAERAARRPVVLVTDTATASSAWSRPPMSPPIPWLRSSPGIADAARAA